MSSANDKLVDAAERGDVAEIERQIAAGADPSANIGTGAGRPLRAAADKGHVAAIAALLKAGARVDGCDGVERTPLMFAALHGRIAAVDALVAAGADVQHADRDGDTALLWASRSGHLDVARVLLEAGARTDVRNKDGQQPIDVVRAPLARCGCAIVPRRCAAALPCAGLRSHPQQVRGGRPARAAGAAARREAARARHTRPRAHRCRRRWCAIAGGCSACRCWRLAGWPFGACARARRRRGCACA
jgi:hypothetical protein